MANGADPIRQMVIAGGGTAGWMAAALVARFLPPPAGRVTLVESDEIGTVGVGEATVPLMAQFHAVLGIDEPAFVAATQGTFKLGIEFRDWGEPGNRHFNGFGDFGAEIEGVAAHHHWLRLRAAGEAAPIEDWSMPAAAARRGRFAPPEAMAARGGGEAGHYRHAYHLDAGLYARFLRAHAEGRGVRRVEGRIAAAPRDAATGRVTELRLADGRAVAGDLFIDCTGFAALLLGGAMGVPFTDWSNWLPCDRAVAVGSARRDPLVPATRSTAAAAGWRWRIPLQHRTGNGHVYASAFASDDQAAATLLAGLDGAALGEPRVIRFTTGHRERFWAGNVVALGLAAGFMEPLESTAIQLVQTGLARLVEYWPDRGFDPAITAEYNRATANEWARVRDFLVAHYCRSRRSEPMWRHCRAAPVPDALAHKLAVWEACGRVPLLSEESYQEPSWVAILLGNGVVPRRWDPMAGQVPLDRLRAGMAARRAAVAALAERMPPHGAFVARACPAPVAA